MHGLPLVLLEQYIVHRRGESALERVLGAAGLADVDPWVVPAFYPDDQLKALLRAAIEDAGADRGDYQRAWYRWSVPRALKRYASLIAGFDSPLALLANLGSVVQPHLNRMHPGEAHMHFNMCRADESGAVFELRTERPACWTIEGALEGLGDYFGVVLQFEQVRCKRRGDECCEFHVRNDSRSAQ
jgi:hypothetical protein